MNLTIGKKILAGFSAVIIATLLMSGYTYYKIGEMNREYHDVTTINLEKLALVEELSAHIIEEAATVRKYNLTGDAADKTKFEALRKESDAKLARMEQIFVTWFRGTVLVIRCLLSLVQGDGSSESFSWLLGSGEPSP